MRILDLEVRKMNKQRREKIRQLKTQIDLIKTDLKKASSALFSILNEEQDAFDNMPEGLQSSCRGMCSEDAIDNMEDNSLESFFKSVLIKSI